MNTKGLSVYRSSSFTALVAVAALAGAGVAHASVLEPISLTGFNQDSVVENSYTISGGAIPTGVAMPITNGGANALFESGLNSSPSGSGLPTSHLFTSSLDGTTVFQFQKYTNTNNLLDLNATTGTTGTLSLSSPASYGSLAILALSSVGQSNSTGAVTLNFSGGVTVTTDYGAPDWFANTSGTTPDGNVYGVAIDNLQRITLSSSQINQPVAPGPEIYQTTLNLASLSNGISTSNYTGDVLQSLTFTQATGSQATGIFAVSGSAVPEPATLGLVAVGGLGLLLLKRRKTV